MQMKSSGGSNHAAISAQVIFNLNMFFYHINYMQTML